MIGANLVRRLVHDGNQVCVLARRTVDRVRLQCIEEHLETVQSDITDAETVYRTVRRVAPDVVYHLASTPFNPPTTDSETHLRVNVLGTCNLLEALRDFTDIRIIFTGSTAVYGSGSHLREDQPPSPGTLFGASKVCASILMQTYARLHGAQTVELRLFTPYGPWEHPRRLVPHTILSALAGRDVALTAGDQERDFVYVDDVVDALVMAATCRLQSGSVLNIGSGVGTPVRAVAGLVLKLMGDPVKLIVGALPTRSDEIMEMSADISAAREELGWVPRTPLRRGLQESIKWITEHRELAMSLV